MTQDIRQPKQTPPSGRICSTWLFGDTPIAQKPPGFTASAVKILHKPTGANYRIFAPVGSVFAPHGYSSSASSGASKLHHTLLSLRKLPMPKSCLTRFAVANDVPISSIASLMSAAHIALPSARFSSSHFRAVAYLPFLVSLPLPLRSWLSVSLDIPSHRTSESPCSFSDFT